MRSEVAEAVASRARIRLSMPVLVGLLVLAAVGPIVEYYGVQQASRYVLTAAIWEERSFRLDAYADVDPPVLGRDRAFRDGHTYSDKAPLQPVLAVPAYGVYRMVGGESAIVQREIENLGLWWAKLWTSALPGALLAAAMYLYMRRARAAQPELWALAVFGGTSLLPFSSLLFGHVLSAAFLFGAFYVVSGSAVTNRTLAVSGLLAGAAVLTEYTAVIGVIAILGYVAWRLRSRAGWFVAGGIPAALALAIYNWLAFGSPLTLSYQWTAYYAAREDPLATVSLFSGLSWSNLVNIFFAGRGLAVATPIVVLGLVGLVRALIRSRGNQRAVAVTALVIFCGFLLVSVGWQNQWGGSSPGPRYMTPAFPFIVIGLPWLWPQVRRAALVIAAVGIATMTLATISFPLMAVDATAGVDGWVRLIEMRGLTPTVYTMVLGSLAGGIVHLGTVGAVIYAIARRSRAEAAG